MFVLVILYLIGIVRLSDEGESAVSDQGRRREMIAQLIPHIFFSCPPFKVEAGSFFRDPELLGVIGIKIALNDKYYVYHLSKKCRDGPDRPQSGPSFPVV